MEIIFPGRSTKMGAFTKTYVFQLNKGVPIPIAPKYTKSSKTGNHWNDIYELEEGQEYLIITTDITNRGNHHCSWKVVKIVNGKFKDVDIVPFFTQDIFDVLCPCLLS